MELTSTPMTYSLCLGESPHLSGAKSKVITKLASSSTISLENFITDYENKFYKVLHVLRVL